jgi:hypothetical protein
MMTPMEEQQAMQAYVRQQVPPASPPQWLSSIYGASMLPQTPGTMSAEDYVANPPAVSPARSVTNPVYFAGQDPLIYSQTPQAMGNQDTVIYPPRPEFVNTMPRSWFSSDPSMGGAPQDRLIRDQRILNMQNYSPETGQPIYRDRDMNALTRSGGGGM